MPSRRKIGIFTRPVDQGTSGSGYHLNEILKRVLVLDKDSEYVLIHYKKTDRQIYRFARELIIPRNPLSAAVKIRKERFDVLHYNPLTIFAPVFIRGPKKIATIHGASILFLSKQFSIIKNIHARAIVPWYARMMDRVITVSQTSKDFIAAAYGVDPGRLAVCYNAVDPVFKKASYTAEDLSFPLNPGTNNILHISRFSERKNPWTLLAAFKYLCRNDKFVNTKLIIAGAGWENDMVSSWLRKNGLCDNVVRAGFISEEDKLKLLNICDLFVFPSLYEGFGIPNLEAMACGCPVITADSFAIKEITGDAALILNDPRDPGELSRCMEMVLSDAALREGLITKGLNQASSFSWEESAERHIQIYSE